MTLSSLFSHIIAFLKEFYMGTLYNYEINEVLGSHCHNGTYHNLQTLHEWRRRSDICHLIIRQEKNHARPMRGLNARL
jgi:hypothetical protein